MLRRRDFLELGGLFRDMLREALLAIDSGQRPTEFPSEPKVRRAIVRIESALVELRRYGEAERLNRLFRDFTMLTKPSRFLPPNPKLALIGITLADEIDEWPVKLRRKSAGLDELVTLNQVAPLVGCSKRTLERWSLPEPDVRGGNGKPHRWYWRKLRRALKEHANRELPAQFPGSRIIS